MSVPFPHPASHCGSRSEPVMCHNPNSAPIVTGPRIEWRAGPAGMTRAPIRSQSANDKMRGEQGSRT